MKPAIRGLMTAVMLGAAARAAAQQSSVVQVAATAGNATDERGVRSSVMTLAPSVLFTNGPNLSIALAASATRFADATSQIGGSAGLSAATPVSPAGFALTLNTSASAVHASFGATFAQADLTPALNWTAGLLTLVGGAHVASGSGGSESETASAPSFGADLRLGAGTPVATLVSLREEPTHVGGMLVTDRLAGATMNFAGGASLSAVIGHRDAPDERTDFATGSAQLPVTGDLSLTVAGGKYPSNRLTGAPGGQFFSMGVSIRVGGSRGPSLPQPAGVLAPAPELTRLSIRATDADSVAIAGDWDAWKQTPAQRAANGVWYVDLPLKAGEYRYAFLVDGREWRVPQGAMAVDDGFGGKAAYVTVRTADSVLAKHNQEER